MEQPRHDGRTHAEQTGGDEQKREAIGRDYQRGEPDAAA